MRQRQYHILLRIIIVSLVTAFLLLPTVQARQVRVSILFIHYSVGTSIVQGYCWDSQYRRNITETLDTLHINASSDTARLVFRSYRMNNESSQNSLSDTLPGSGENGCAFDRFNNFEYDFYGGSYNRVRIWNSNNGFTGPAFAGLLDQFFNVPNKENEQFWKIFKTHNVPSSFPDSVTEVDGYDLVIIKNPYACWFQMTQAQADSIKVLYRAVRDSIVNHPEINVALAFGTPLLLGHEVSDSTQAKITYNLASWFASDSFFTHSNTGIYKNIWKWDSYRLLCEMAEVPNRYCLKAEYHANDGSHLSHAGASVGQDSMVEFIKQAVRDILIQRAGVTTRNDIDRAIRDYQNGNITEQEVINLIQQYNTGG